MTTPSGKNCPQSQNSKSWLTHFLVFGFANEMLIEMVLLSVPSALSGFIGNRLKICTTFHETIFPCDGILKIATQAVSDVTSLGVAGWMNTLFFLSKPTERGFCRS